MVVGPWYTQRMALRGRGKRVTSSPPISSDPYRERMRRYALERKRQQREMDRRQALPVEEQRQLYSRLPARAVDEPDTYSRTPKIKARYYETDDPLLPRMEIIAETGDYVKVNSLPLYRDLEKWHARPNVYLLRAALPHIVNMLRGYQQSNEMPELVAYRNPWGTIDKVFLEYRDDLPFPHLVLDSQNFGKEQSTVLADPYLPLLLRDLPYFVEKNTSLDDLPVPIAPAQAQADLTDTLLGQRQSATSTE